VELEQDLRTLLVVWVVIAVVVAFRHWRDGSGVGLVFTYILTLAAMHWLAPVIYLVPWYRGGRLDFTVEGLRQSTYALAAFAVGAEIGLAALRRRGLGVGDSTADSLAPRPADPRLINLYLLVGAVLYVVVFPLAGRLPSATAIVSTGSTLAIVAVCLKCWNAVRTGRRTTLWLWLAATATLPIVTVVGQGFLGYGLAAMLTVFAFVASFYRPRWRVVLLGMFVGYLGLSVYVTYMRDRADIREVVWSGGAMEDRMAQLRSTLTNVELFNPDNEDHLRRVDLRLNQDLLIGAAVGYLNEGSVDFARGATFRDAVLGLIPRAIWPAKPIVAGSGDLVSTYTGFTFAEGTSVGIGQVLESYVNFAETGIVAVFLLIGGVLVVVDRMAWIHLASGSVDRFVLFYLPGLSLLQIGGSLVEVTTSAAAGIVVAVMLNRVVPAAPGTGPEELSADDFGPPSAEQEGREAGL